MNVLDTALDLPAQDCAVLVPVFDDTTNLEQDADRWSAEHKQLWQLQISAVLTRHWNYVKGFDVTRGFFIPPGYSGLADACREFLNDHPDYRSNVFLMTRFDSNEPYLGQLDAEVRAVLRDYGLNPVRADDRIYPSDRNLWNNVCVYMIGCSLGIAILEDRGINEFNPNVAIEYGFMRGLNKPSLLLADRGFRNLRADVIGTLREEFDLLSMSTTVRPTIERWLRDLGIQRTP